MVKNLDETLNTILYPFINENFIFCDEFDEGDFEKLFISQFIEDKNLKNIDWLRLALKKYYKDCLNKEKNIRLNKLCLKSIDEISRALITIRDGSLCYKYWENENDCNIFGHYKNFEKIEIYRRINSAITMDTISMYFLVNRREQFSIDEIDKFYSYVKLADKQLDDILISGIAENHIHANAALSFNFLWKLINSDIDRVDEVLKKTNIKYINNSDIWKCNMNNLVKVNVLVRTVLAIFLQNYIDYNSKDTLSSFFLKDKESSFSRKFYELIEIISIDKLNYKDIYNRFTELENYNFYEVFNLLLKEYAIEKNDKNYDILSKIFTDVYNLRTYEENVFLAKAFQYLKENNDDGLFLDLFMNYIRIKNYFYSTFCNNTKIKGLDIFTDFYNNGTGMIEEAINPIEGKNYYKDLIRSEFQNENLKYAELRITPSKNIELLRKKYYEILEAYREVIKEDYKDKRFPRIGLVYHFIKSDDLKEDKSYNKHFENEKKYLRISETLIKFRNENPYNSYFIVGIDAASLENNMGVFTLTKAFLNCRGSEIDYLKVDDGDGNLVNVKSLGFTFHAGEDFRHMLSGLRRVDEVINKFKYHAADRIGHGTVLGLDVENWACNNHIILIPRKEKLYNLLWVWNKISKYKLNNHNFSVYLEKEIINLATEILKEDESNFNCREEKRINNNKILGTINIPKLYDMYRNLFSKEVSGEDEKIYENIDDFIKTYSFKDLKKNQYIKEKMDEPIYVEINEIEIDIIKEMQRILIEQIAEKGIVVEINPSSNTSIGEFNSVLENHSMNLNKIEEMDAKNVIITINSDDPMLFNTTLSNEYAYIYYSQLNKGLSKEKILFWIDKIRKYSIDTSFVERKISDEKYLEYLEKVLEKNR
ncbi:MAG: hypothetical protein ACRDDY_00655 [Clostridium sp.]|uniref:hypothetical protein n=1 Tax=Clostridium sp. TaxID=1506 RepID=UPI003EE6FCC4